MRRLVVLLFALLPLSSLAADAPVETPASLKKTVEAFVRGQLADQPGAAFSIGAVDSRLRLPACPQREAFLPPGGRLWGNATIGVRCDAPSPWTIYVPVSVTISGQVIVTLHAMARGQVIHEGDIKAQEQDLTQLPGGVLTSPEQALGKTLLVNIPAAFPLRQDMLKAPLAIYQGQTVRITATRGGLTVYNEGKALGNASEGQPVDVRTSAGQVVKGIARSGGVVEISF